MLNHKKKMKRSLLLSARAYYAVVIVTVMLNIQDSFLLIFNIYQEVQIEKLVVSTVGSPDLESNSVSNSKSEDLSLCSLPGSSLDVVTV